MTFNNEQISKMWRNSWNQKEEALRARYVKTLENLNEHARFLPGLQCGEHVLIQNQTGRFPKKWGKSGVVVEIKDHHQYVVKVDGSGRLTLRNRQFLRRYQPPSRTTLSSEFAFPATSVTKTTECKNGMDNVLLPHNESPFNNDSNPHMSQSDDTAIQPIVPAASTGDLPTASSVLDKTSSPVQPVKQKTKHLLSRLADYNKPGLTECQPDIPSGTVGNEENILRRSTRTLAPRKMYDAASEKFNEKFF